MQPKTFYYQNQEVLANHTATLAQKLASLPVNPHFKVEVTRSGDRTLLVHDIAIHSRYNPIHEAKKDVQSIPLDADVIILAGMGLGYLALEIIRERPRSHLIILEPNLDFWLVAQHTLDLQQLYAFPKLILLSDNIPEMFQQVLLSFTNRHIYWHELRSRVSSEKELFQPFKKIYQEYQQRVKTNQLALQQYGLLWWRNSIKNLSYWPKAKAVRTLFQRASSFPILVIGAGPSLSYHRKQLKQLQERMLIICVDTALRILLAENIRPDVVVSIDSQYWNARHLDQLDLREIRYVVDSAVHPMLIHRIDPKYLYMLSPIVPLMQPLEAQLPPFGFLRSGGSVSITAWDLALRMNPPSIWLLGVDLGYPHQATHAKGALFELWILAQVHRFQTIFNHHSMLQHPNTLQLENNRHEPIQSDARMHLYLRWLEEALPKESIPSYNLSTLGVKITGMPYRTIEEALALPVQRDEINKAWAREEGTTAYYNETERDRFTRLIHHSYSILSSFLQRLTSCPNENLNSLKEDPAMQYFQPILPFWVNTLLQSQEFDKDKASLIARMEHLLTLYPL